MRKLIACCALALLLFAVAAAAFAASAVQAVELTASDGTRLKAAYFPAAQPGPGVLLLHQCNRDSTVWAGLAQQLSAAGINVLTLDYRGFGESGGVPHQNTTPLELQAELAKWPSDIEVAFRYLQSQPGVARDMIGVGGADCGVNISVHTALRHPEVRSLVLLSGNTDYPGRQFLRKAVNLPVLFGYASDDEFPESITTTQWLYSLDPNSGKKMVRYAKGGHGADIFNAHPKFVQVITNWYVTTLVKTPGQAPPSPPFAVPQQVQVLNTLDEPGGPAKVKTELQQARQSDSKATLFPEAPVNFMGYEHLLAGDTQGALEILSLNAMAYPNSPNVYDSLGDAYLADGQKDLARQNSKKALELLASDTTDTQQRKDAIQASAQEKLTRLGDAAQ